MSWRTDRRTTFQAITLGQPTYVIARHAGGPRLTHLWSWCHPRFWQIRVHRRSKLGTRMSHTYFSKALTSLFMAIAYAQTAPGPMPIVLTPVTRFPAIIVAELEHIGTTDCGGRSSRTCKLPVRVQVIRVLKNANGLNLPQRSFEIDLPVHVGDPGGGEGNVWTNRRNGDSGFKGRRQQRYLCLSLSIQGLPLVMLLDPGRI